MLEYEGWGNPSQMILTNSDDVVHHVHSVVDHNHNPNHHHHGIDIFNTTTTTTDHNNSNVSASALSLDYTHHHNNTNTFSNNNYHFFNNNNTSNNHLHHHHHHHQFYDSRPFSTYNPFDNISNNSTTPSYFLVPKIEENSSSIMSRHGAATGSTRIGLNLGHRTYFSAQDDDFVNRLYRRSRHGGGGGGMEGLVNGMVNSPKCQAEGCVADLSNAKHYHRRHKVCEFHSKASTVIAGGLTQRFCQQCSRFHLLNEFDNGKRSCRKRLADHNRRRRKTPQIPSSSSTSQSQLELQKSPVETTSFNNLESPTESSAMTHLSSSSVTIAISPPRMSLECFRQRSFMEMASTSSSSSVFYSN